MSLNQESTDQITAAASGDPTAAASICAGLKCTLQDLSHNSNLLLGESTGFWIQTVAILLSALAAIFAIRCGQLSVRKRATIDLAFSQRNDTDLKKAKKKLKELHSNGDGMAKYASKDYLGSEESDAILKILNHYEFIASGIREGAFDEKIYKRMQYGLVTRDWESLNGYIADLRKARAHKTLFQEFEWLGKRWKKKSLKSDNK